MKLKKKLTTVCLICISLIFITACQKAESQIKPKTPAQSTVATGGPWQKLNDPEGDFSILFPGQMEHVSDIIEVAHVKNVVRHAYSSNYEFCAFGVSYFTIPIKTDDGYRRIMNSVQAGTIKQNIQEGWQMMNQQVLPGNGIQTDWAIPTNGIMSYMRQRQYYRSSRAYSIMFNSYELKDLDGNLSKRFFSSLHFKGEKLQSE
jgi:hypothetical protein